MPSVTVTWNGRTTDRAVQDALLGYLTDLAELSALLEQYPAQLPPVSRMLAAQRAEGLPVREAIERIDFIVRGPTAISGDVTGDPDAFIAEAKEAGLTVETRDGGWPYVVVPEVAVRGIDFRLYDPRRLYPGADRLSFVFLDTPELPFLHGRLVSQIRAEQLPDGHPLRDKVFWSITSPSIQLRYVLEGWTQRLMAWVRFFFIDDLSWQAWSTMEFWDEARRQYDGAVKQRGRDTALRESFETLKESMITDAAQWLAQFAAMENAGEPSY